MRTLIRAMSACIIIALSACDAIVDSVGNLPNSLPRNDQVGSNSTSITVTDLGTLGGNNGIAFAINPRGQIVGTSRDANGQDRPFLWEKGVMTDLGTLTDGAQSTAYGVNASGKAVGYMLERTHALATLWQDGEIIDLGTLGGPNAIAAAINASGAVTGHFTGGDKGALHAFIWRKGEMVDLGTTGDCVKCWAGGLAINNAGQIVGWTDVESFPSGDLLTHAFLWDNGKTTDLGTLPGAEASYARAINEAGDVVGYTLSADGRVKRGFLWRKGTMTELPLVANGINSSGDIVGYITMPDRTSHAALLRKAELIDLGFVAGYTESVAYAINDAGEIVGSSLGNASGTLIGRATMWTVR